MDNRICGHCGQVAQGYASAGDTPLCHHDDYPDCYRLVTIYKHDQNARGACAKCTSTPVDTRADYLRPFIGRWVAITAGEVIYAADSPADVLHHLRTEGITAESMFRVPDVQDPDDQVGRCIPIAGVHATPHTGPCPLRSA